MAKRAIEQTGLIPRSIIRTLERFKKQLFPGAEMLVLQEFRISRYQVIVSVQALVTLVFIPILVNILSKFFIITPIVKYLWNTHQSEIFLYKNQQNCALEELKRFEEQIYFESLLESNFENQTFVAKSNKLNLQPIEFQLKDKIFELASLKNQESIESISNLFADLLSFCSLSLVFIFMKPQLIILKSFLAESLYSLSDTTKSFLLILGTDLLVGFHSPRGWEVILQWFFNHFGLPENTEFMSLFVATFPVFLDTVFKYWIFRSLNKISPSTVATYHNMIE